MILLLCDKKNKKTKKQPRPIFHSCGFFFRQKALPSHDRPQTSGETNLRQSIPSLSYLSLSIQLNDKSRPVGERGSVRREKGGGGGRIFFFKSNFQRVERVFVLLQGVEFWKIIG